MVSLLPPQKLIDFAAKQGGLSAADAPIWFYQHALFVVGLLPGVIASDSLSLGSCFFFGFFSVPRCLCG